MKGDEEIETREIAADEALLDHEGCGQIDISK